jgi:hypothetical protein
MNFNDLMLEIVKMCESWESDPLVINGTEDEQDIRRQLLLSVQNAIKSNSVIMKREDYEEMRRQRDLFIKSENLDH